MGDNLDIASCCCHTWSPSAAEQFRAVSPIDHCLTSAGESSFIDFRDSWIVRQLVTLGMKLGSRIGPCRHCKLLQDMDIL